MPALLDMTDLWSADQPLPCGGALAAMVQRALEFWREPALSARVRVLYNSRLRSALGKAFLRENVIHLNPTLLAANPSQLVPTLVHELAHLVVHARFGSVGPHGPHFRCLMAQAGFKGRATVRLENAPVRPRRSRYLYLHVCPLCRQRFIARSVRRNTYCRQCGPDMQWSVYRAPHTQQGLQSLETLQPQSDSAAGTGRRAGRQ